MEVSVISIAAHPDMLKVIFDPVFEETFLRYHDTIDVVRPSSIDMSSSDAYHPVETTGANFWLRRPMTRQEAAEVIRNLVEEIAGHGPGGQSLEINIVFRDKNFHPIPDPGDPI